MEGEGWLPAKELQQGDLVRLQSGKSIPVENTELVVLDKPVKVYNFHVEGFHTYFVSSHKALVHNMCAERAANKLYPNPKARGAHSVFNTNSRTGKITHYATYKVNGRHPSGFSLSKRYDATGKADYSKKLGKYVMTPHVHAKGGVRSPKRWEIPRWR